MPTVSAHPGAHEYVPLTRALIGLELHVVLVNHQQLLNDDTDRFPQGEAALLLTAVFCNWLPRCLSAVPYRSESGASIEFENGLVDYNVGALKNHGATFLSIPQQRSRYLRTNIRLCQQGRTKTDTSGLVEDIERSLDRAGSQHVKIRPI